MMTFEFREEAVARYLAGETSVEVGEAMGCHPSSVINWVRAAGRRVREAKVRPRKRAGQPTRDGPGGAHHFAPEEEVIRLRDEEMMSFAAIGKALGFSRQRAHQIYTAARLIE